MSSYQSINHQRADQATCHWPIKYCVNSNFGHLFPTFRHPFDRLFNYPKSFHGLVHRFHGIYYIFFQFWNTLIQILDTSFQVLNLRFKFFNLDPTSLLLHLWLRLLPLAEFIALHWLIDKYWIQFSSFGTQISRYVTPFIVLKHLFSNFKGPLQFLNIPFQVFLRHSLCFGTHVKICYAVFQFWNKFIQISDTSFKFWTTLFKFLYTF